MGINNTMGNICNDLCGMEPSSSQLAKRRPTCDQAGGHEGGITFDGAIIKKKTKASEVENYRLIFDEENETSLTKMRQFVPKFYGAEEDECSEQIQMTIENLL